MRIPADPTLQPPKVLVTPYLLCSQCGERWDGSVYVEHRLNEIGCGNRGYFRMVGDDTRYQVFWFRDGRCRIWASGMGEVYLSHHLPLNVDVAGIRMALTFQ